MTDEGDLFEPLTDGRIKLQFSGTTYLLRAPKLGEYKSLKAALVEMTTSFRDLAAKMASEQAELAEIPDDDSKTAAQSIIDLYDRRLANYDKNDRQAELQADLVMTIMETLQDKPVDRDDLPTWLVEGTTGTGENAQGVINIMFGHWRAVPLGPGK